MYVGPKLVIRIGPTYVNTAPKMLQPACRMHPNSGALTGYVNSVENAYTMQRVGIRNIPSRPVPIIESTKLCVGNTTNKQIIAKRAPKATIRNDLRNQLNF